MQKYKNRGINIFLPKTCQRDGPWVLVIIVTSDAPLATVEIGCTVFIALCLSYSCGTHLPAYNLGGEMRERVRE